MSYKIQSKDIGNISDPATTNVGLNSSMISILKGMLYELQNLDINADNLEVNVDGSTVAISTISAGASVDIGAKSDAAITNPTSSASTISLLKGLLKYFQENVISSEISTISSGASVDIGSVDDEQAIDSTSSSSIISVLKGMLYELQNLDISGGTKIETTHHNEATGTGNGTAAVLDGQGTLTLQIEGTSTSRTVDFYGSRDGTNYTPIMGVNMETFDTGITTTGSSEVWQFDVSGLAKFVADLSAVAGGNVTITSTAL